MRPRGKTGVSLLFCGGLLFHIVSLCFFCVFRKFSIRMLQLGAKEFVPLGLGDDQAGFGYNTALYPWLASFWRACEVAKLTPEPATGQNSENTSTGAGMSVDGHYKVRLVEAAPGAESAAVATTHARRESMLKAVHCCADIVSATVACAERTTHPDWSQDVRVLELLLPEVAGVLPVTFLGGDVACLYPENSDAFMLRLLARLAPALATLTGAASSTPAPLSLEDAGRVALHIEATEQCPVRKTRLLGLAHRPGSDNSSTLQCSLLELLKFVLDIQGVPKPSFFEVCAHYAADLVEQEKLLEMASAEGTDLYYDYCVQERRNFVEVLEEFRSVAIDLPRLCAIVPLLKPREFSLASSTPATKNNVSCLC
jgi:sulfite reductase alpha subunit-like flavoprotein